MKKIISSDEEMQAYGECIGRVLSGGDVVELVGDVGAGKTTLTKGIARGLEIDEVVQSPTFTISRQYDARDGLRLAHYDFYRLVDAGIMAGELEETVTSPRFITAIEWSEIVAGVLPKDRLTVSIEHSGETERQITLQSGGERSTSVVRSLE